MKFIVSSSVLLKNLQAISGALGTSSPLPILSSFLFDLDGDELRITCSDLETTMTVQMKVTKAEESGKIAIPARRLLDTLKALPDIPVTFIIDNATRAIELLAGEGQYKMNGEDSKDFPETPVIAEGKEITIGSAILASAIGNTVFAAGYDEMRPVLSGVFLEMKPEEVSFVATDAHRLVCYSRKDITVENEDGIIIPTKPLNQIKNLLSAEDFEVRMAYDKKNVSFSFSNIHMVSKLIEGVYPNYRMVIPLNNPNKLLIERLPFLNAIRRVSIYSSKSTFQVQLSLSGNSLKLSARDIDFSSEAHERLNCHYEGEPMEIAFNSKFLTEMLGILDSEEVVLELSQPNRAGIIKPVTSGDQSTEDIKMVLMPLMLNV